MKVPFVDLKTQYQALRSEIDSGMQQVCEQGSFILGPQVREFESAFAEYVEGKFCIGVASGTDALHLAFRALGIGPGDEVIIPAHTFVATAIGVIQAGATPKIVDIDPKTYQIDSSKLEGALSKRTKAICPVHLYGASCDMDKISAFASSNKLFIVEDAAQSHGARWNGKRSGSFGQFGCFSFYPGKNLGAYGDGGALVTSDPELAEKAKALRNYGSQVKYFHPVFGFNSRLDSVQAAVLNAKLKHLDRWNQARWEAAAQYAEELSPLQSKGLVLPEIRSSSEHVFHLFVVQVPRRDGLMEHLKTAGIESGIHYPNPFHLQGGYSFLGYKAGDFPVTEKISQNIVSLPMFPEITREQIKYVTSKVAEFVSSKV